MIEGLLVIMGWILVGIYLLVGFIIGVLMFRQDTGDLFKPPFPNKAWKWPIWLLVIVVMFLVNTIFFTFAWLPMVVYGAIKTFFENMNKPPQPKEESER
jgi:hypothetical protein